ncbi:acyltransferase [Archangium sp.]|uniref:acyltransferase family protein n=1 Tax=Archangium sp. TaxID=1872627 RepID=UPI002D308F6E|nr:acyltransferase [Archangium sp.]HYO51649.1 acyltransferase [Archangium sp.]
MEAESSRDVGSSARRMTLVDGLRGFAALAVVLPHAAGLFMFPGAGALSELMVQVALFGRRGVEVFFALSGFVIAFTLRRTRLSPGGVGNFILRRSMRLDPPYWVAIALFCGFLLLRTVMTGKPAGFPSGMQLLTHLLYLQDLLGYGQINVAFWTLCVEFQFYLSFAVLLGLAQALSRRLGRDGLVPWFFSALFVPLLAWPSGLVPVETKAVTMSLLPHAYIFLSGALTWWALEGRLPRGIWYAFILLLWGVFLWLPDSRTFAAAATCSILYVAGRRQRLYTWLSPRPFQYLGRISYSIYLVHVPLCLLLLSIRVRFAQPSDGVALAFLGAVLAASIAAAHLLYTRVEAPCVEWARRLKR